MNNKEIGDLLKKEKSQLFLDFMLANGFNPNNYSKILELIQSVPDSLSKYLNDYEQFLLSKKVEYPDLERYDVKGALGYIDNDNGIIVPKTFEADEYFNFHKPKVPYHVHGYIYPSILDFDSVVALHDWDSNSVGQLKSTLYYPIENYYLGFITDKFDANLGIKVDYYRLLLDVINKKNIGEHTIIHDTITSEDKELYLIKRKK